VGKFRAIERSVLTKDWGVDERAALAHFLVERKISEGDPIFLKQSKERSLYFIELGLIRFQHETISVELKEGDSFGELSLLNESSKLVSATAQTPCQLWVLTFDKFQEMKKTTPLVAVKLTEAIATKIAKALSVFSIPQRILTGSGSPPTPAKITGAQTRPQAF